MIYLNTTKLFSPQTTGLDIETILKLLVAQQEGGGIPPALINQVLSNPAAIQAIQDNPELIQSFLDSQVNIIDHPMSYRAQAQLKDDPKVA